MNELVARTSQEGTLLGGPVRVAALALREGKLVRPVGWRGRGAAVMGAERFERVMIVFGRPKGIFDSEMTERTVVPILRGVDLFFLGESLPLYVPVDPVNRHGPVVGVDCLWEEVDFATIDGEYAMQNGES